MDRIPSQDTLRELLDYDPATGVLTWKRRSDKWFPDARSSAVWNSRFAGKVAVNNLDDYGRRHGYVLRKMCRAHRVVWKLVYGTEPECIDHIDGNASNNRLCNLREVTQAENMKNVKLNINNKTGTPGVHFDKSRGLYMAYVDSNRKRRYLGRFGTLEEAVEAREAVNDEYGFHENHGRVVA